MRTASLFVVASFACGLSATADAMPTTNWTTSDTTQPQTTQWTDPGTGPGTGTSTGGAGAATGGGAATGAATGGGAGTGAGTGGGNYGNDSCFVAGTPVATLHGDRAIEELRVGDSVLAWDLASERAVPRRVLAVHHKTNTEFLQLVAGDHVVGAVTPTHPFWNPSEDAWIAAGKLQVGDTVAVVQRGRLKTVTLDKVDRWTDVSTPVYTLTVAGEENFIADGFLVHNKTPQKDCDDCNATGGVFGGWLGLILALALVGRRRES